MLHILSLPAIYLLELTTLCNNHCAGCSNLHAANQTAQTAPAKIWKTWLANFGPEAAQIRLSGGEPSLHPDFFEILEAATAYDAWVTVFTNGRWKNPEEFVKRLRNWPKLSGLLISLHGSCAKSHEAFNQTPGSFQETLANIELAVKNGLNVALSTVLHRHNLLELEAIVALGKTLGVQHIAFNRFLSAPDPSLEPSSKALYQAVQKIERIRQNGEQVKY